MNNQTLSMALVVVVTVVNMLLSAYGYTNNLTCTLAQRDAHQAAAAAALVTE
jgi:hypothetical protein